MLPSGAAGDARTERVAGRTTKGRVAHTRMARSIEMNMVRTSIGMAELPLDVPSGSKSPQSWSEHNGR
jgi:hypothetical protein